MSEVIEIDKLSIEAAESIAYRAVKQIRALENDIMLLEQHIQKKYTELQTKSVPQPEPEA